MKDLEKDEADDPPFDKGVAAYSCLLGCALSLFATFGFTLSLGVYLASYERQFPDAASSSISLIASVNACEFKRRSLDCN